jgi:predicted membrane protein
MVHTRLFVSQIVLQIVVGTLAPIALLASARIVESARLRRLVYIVAGILTLVGIFAMRWNVVIGGQLFSKSFLGYTTYKLEFATREGLGVSLLLLILPFLLLAGLVRFLPPWSTTSALQEDRRGVVDDPAT